MCCRYQRIICQIIHKFQKKLQIIFMDCIYLEKYMSNYSHIVHKFNKSLQIISMNCRYQRNICQIIHKLFTNFRKSYKSFLWTADISEIYVKLFANCSQISEKTTNCSHKLPSRSPCRGGLSVPVGAGGTRVWPGGAVVGLGAAAKD